MPNLAPSSFGHTTDAVLPHSRPRTDPLGWRLVVGQDSHGQHKWIYLPPGDERRQGWEQSKEDKYWLGLDVEAPTLPPAKTPLEAARKGFEFYKLLQSEDGHWSGAYGGPLFLIPGVVIGLYVCNLSLRPEQVIEIRRYLLRKRRAEGGWGLHTAAPPTAYGTILSYVSLRILGMDAEDPVMREVRGLIHEMGGAIAIPSWGKAWLSILNAYEWEGVNPVPPELWLLPEWVPFHPRRWWTHTRNVYMPLGYLYGKKWKGKLTPLVEEIRKEIYTQPYDTINFAAQRNNICKLDLYVPHHFILDGLNAVLATYESCAIPALRRAGIKAAYNLVRYEDENTNCQTIGPVSKMFNMVVRFVEDGPDSEAFKLHSRKIEDFLWMSEDGLMMCGTNGSQLWDLAFISQALQETGLAEEPENQVACMKALDWLDKAQIKTDPKWHAESHRHSSKGAWPFSTPEQGYTVSDCVGEGLKAVLALQSLSYTPTAVAEHRLQDAVDVILSLQNPNGSFASYELIRGYKEMEILNTAEVFGNIMIEYPYPECTASAITALFTFNQKYPAYRRAEIKNCIGDATEWIKESQRPDGSWFGSWGICFTYATMFALEALAQAREAYATSEVVRRACNFLTERQMEDGGWGETYMSCVTGSYAQHEQSQVVQTCWVIRALIIANFPHKEIVRKAADLVMSRQQPNGSWLQEDVEGIFNKNCGIDYPNYKFSFTIWALGKADKYLAGHEDE